MNNSDPEAPPYCLRCKTVALVPLASPDDMHFFECPSCGRNFARREGGSLCFRWGHPITLLLYPVIFTPTPLEECERVVSQFASEQSAETIQLAIQEIRLELDDPTQLLRDTVGSAATEQDVRAYLDCVASHLASGANR